MFSYWLTYIFTPTGRFRRRDWHCVWMTSALVNLNGILIYVAVCLNLKMLQIGPDFHLHTTETMPSALTTSVSVVSFIWGICTFVAGLMATIKRFHDHGNSGWNCIYIYFPFPFILLGVVFFFLSMQTFAWGTLGIYILFLIYLLIKLGFLRGSDHDNHYGMNPYQGEMSPPGVGFVFGMVGFLLIALIPSVYMVAKDYIAVIEAQKAEAESKKAQQMSAADKAIKLTQDTLAQNNKIKQDAGLGNAEAQYQLSFLCTTGSAGIAKSDTDAAAWLLRAAMQGHTGAQYNLGIFYLNGTGLAVDYKRSYFWLSSAVLNGYHDSGNYRALAASKLAPADVADVDQRLKAWKPVIETPAAPPK